jgi:hypothetical protein
MPRFANKNNNNNKIAHFAWPSMISTNIDCPKNIVWGPRAGFIYIYIYYIYYIYMPSSSPSSLLSSFSSHTEYTEMPNFPGGEPTYRKQPCCTLRILEVDENVSQVPES